jgi:hypothetical protein
MGVRPAKASIFLDVFLEKKYFFVFFKGKYCDISPPLEKNMRASMHLQILRQTLKLLTHYLSIT